MRSKLLPQLRSTFVKLAPALVAEHGKDIQHAPGSNPSSGFTTPKYLPTAGATSQSAPKPSAQKDSRSTVNTTTVSDTQEFRTTAAELYQTFTDPQRIAAFTREPPRGAASSPCLAATCRASTSSWRSRPRLSRAGV